MFERYTFPGQPGTVSEGRLKKNLKSLGVEPTPAVFEENLIPAEDGPDKVGNYQQVFSQLI